MKKFLLTVFVLAIGIAAFGQQFRARIDVNGLNDLELKPVENGKLRHISWGSEEKRKFSMTGEDANLVAGKWTEVTFAFIPEQDGVVRVNLMGSWNKAKGKKNNDQVWIYFDSVSVNGAGIINGDFSEVNNGVPVGWRCAKEQYITGGLDFHSGAAAVKVWHNQPCRQDITVKSGQKVTITAFVRPAEYVAATE